MATVPPVFLTQDKGPAIRDKLNQLGVQFADAIDNALGPKGWSPVFAVVTDGARRVLQVTDWVGGEGTKPATGDYVGSAGLVSTIASAVDIRGSTGATGAANTLTIGTVTQGAANASITGSAPNQTLNLVIPQGAAGSAATVTVGTVTTGAPGSSVSVTNSGTSSAAVFNFTIPRGDAGAGSGDVVGPASAVNLRIAVFDGTTGKLVKDGGVTVADLATAASVAAKLDASEKGAANGVAPLGADSKISSTYLPSYVDDVLEYANFAALPGTGETGKIYVTIDNNKQFRWSGSAYGEINPSPGSTDAVPEGSTNKYFTEARVRATVATGLADTAGAPAATDSFLTILGKIKKVLYTDIGATIAAAISAAADKATPVDADSFALIDSENSGVMKEFTWANLKSAIWSATATLVNKTLLNYTEATYTVVDAAGVAISPTNGALQKWTLGASRTPTLGTWADGQSLKLRISDGTAFTITWTTMGVVWIGGTPTLATTGYTHVELWKEDGVLYGTEVGDSAS